MIEETYYTNKKVKRKGKKKKKRGKKSKKQMTPSPLLLLQANSTRDAEKDKQTLTRPRVYSSSGLVMVSASCSYPVTDLFLLV